MGRSCSGSVHAVNQHRVEALKGDHRFWVLRRNAHGAIGIVRVRLAGCAPASLAAAFAVSDSSRSGGRFRIEQHAAGAYTSRLSPKYLQPGAHLGAPAQQGATLALGNPAQAVLRGVAARVLFVEFPA